MHESIIRMYPAARLVRCRVKPMRTTFNLYRAKSRDIFCCYVKRVTVGVKVSDKLSGAYVTNGYSA